MNHYLPDRSHTQIVHDAMSAPPRFPRQFHGALLLFAALALFATRIGITAPFVTGNSASSAMAAEMCCDSHSAAGCTEAGNGPIDSACLSRCAQANTAKQFRAGLPAPANTACAGAPYTGRVLFLPLALRSGAAPPAVSGTPLIYLLQRLLI